VVVDRRWMPVTPLFRSIRTRTTRPALAGERRLRSLIPLTATALLTSCGPTVTVCADLSSSIPATAELRALVRMRDDHVAAMVAAMGQLAALLDRHWPGAKAIFARLDSDIALDFLTDYPTPESA
jgi:hypothetical protein